MKKIDLLMSNQGEFFRFLKNHFPLYHLSNVFLRDIQYGIMKYFESKRNKVKYAEAEKIARQFTDAMEKKDVLRRLNHQSWVLNYPEFSKKAS